jgi:CRP/FNR family cyclic AMP-dependent transcriptional regulator
MSNITTAVDKIAILQQADWYRYLPVVAIEQLAKAARWKHYPKGGLIQTKGSDSIGVLGFVTGRARSSYTTREGQEIVLSDLEPGLWIGELSTESGEPHTQDVFAKEDTTVLFIPKADFLRAGEQWPELYHGLFNELVKRSRLLHDLVHVSHQGIPQKAKLAFRLLTLLDIHGVDSADGTHINMKLTQEELASLTGGSRQFVNQTIKAWVESGILNYNRGQIVVLDSQALKQEANN